MCVEGGDCSVRERSKKKKKRERMNVANLNALTYPQWSTCYY